MRSDVGRTAYIVSGNCNRIRVVPRRQENYISHHKLDPGIAHSFCCKPPRPWIGHHVHMACYPDMCNRGHNRCCHYHYFTAIDRNVLIGLRQSCV